MAPKLRGEWVELDSDETSYESLRGDGQHDRRVSGSRVPLSVQRDDRSLAYSGTWQAELRLGV